MKRVREALERDYQVLLSERNTFPDKETNPENDRRRAPRFPIQYANASIRIQPTFDVVDISLCGMAFYSDRGFQPGQELSMVMPESPDVPCTVVSCRMVEMDGGLMDYAYLVAVEFTNPHRGKHAVVMLSERDRLHGTL